MKKYHLLIALLLTPLIAIAADITQCQQSFHGIDSNQNIDAKAYIDYRHVKKIETRLHRK